MKPEKRKVLLIGWDAADWKVINPLMDAGKMPALESLVNGGVMGNLATIEPPFSPMLWTSIATGMHADKHGVMGFTEPAPNNKGVRPVSSTSRRVKAVWNILMQNGLKTHCIGWWPSHPAEPLNGVAISNHYQKATADLGKPWKMAPGTVHPRELAPLFAALRVHPGELTEAHLLPFVPKAAEVDQEKDKRLSTVAKILAECSSIHAAATWILENEEWDFLAVYYDAIDHFCHAFMNFHPPKMASVPEEMYELYKEVVAGGYLYHDMMLQRLLELAGEDVTVILISDHGFHSDHLRPRFIPVEAAGPAHQHRDIGVFCMKGEGVKGDEIVYGASLLDIAPTILSLYGLPLGEDMDGKPIVNAFAVPSEIKTIPSWEMVNGECGMHPEEMIEDPYVAREALKQLVELGYIEDPGEDAKKAVEKTIMESKYNLARVYLGSDRGYLALPILEELFEQDPSQSRFAFRIANLYLSMSRAEDCKKLIERFRTAGEGREALEKELQTLREELNGETIEEKEKEKLQEKIRRTARKIEQRGMDRISLELLQADVLLKENKPVDALNLYRDIEKRFPQQKNLYLRIGNTYRQLKKWKLAEFSYKKALEVDAESPDACHGLAVAFLRQRRYIEAIHEALNAIGFRYFFPFAHYHLGEALMKIKNYKGAAEAFEVSLSMNPGIGKARNHLIWLYGKKLNLPEKAEKYRRFFEALPIPAPEATMEAQAKQAVPAGKGIKERTLKNPLVIVSGLPRSGTSMMMQMLVQGGMTAFTDAKRGADESNPEGYFEHEAVKRTAYDKSWLKDAGGKVTKVVSPLLRHLPDKYNYKIIFMLRDIDEVVSSQKKMLEREGKSESARDPEKLKEAFRKNMQQIDRLLDRFHNIDMIYVNFSDVIRNPEPEANRIAEFLGGGLDVAAMASSVKQELYRAKATPSLAAE